MGDFDADTAIEAVDGAGGRYTATLSQDWEIWGPNGGYLGTILLRAAGAHSAFDRPATFACHFLGVAEFAPVEMEVVTLRRGRRAESLRVSMTQGDHPVAEALVWTVADAEGLEHDWVERPDVPEPEAVTPFVEQRAVEDPERPVYRFWDNLDYRPLDWVSEAEWIARGPVEPVERAWYRFLPRATFDDPYVDAGRSLLIIDTMMWPAATSAHPGNHEWMAPSMDVTVTFHRSAPDSEYLYGDTRAPVAAGGLIGGHARVFSEEGLLLASGTQQLLCRNVPPPHRREAPEGS